MYIYVCVWVKKITHQRKNKEESNKKLSHKKVKEYNGV